MEIDYSLHLILYVVASFLGFAGAWIVSRHAHLIGLIDRPNERSSHGRPTPKGGGIGILASFIIASVFSHISPLFWSPITFLSIISLFGDRINLKPGLRLTVQFGVVLFIFSSIGLQSSNPENEYLSTSKLILFISFFSVFIVGTANFYNFMDGINGIAGITGITGFCLLGAYGIFTGQQLQWITLAFTMAFACGGFLPLNIPRAKVFMGDVGSILLGFIFAFIVFVFTRSFSDFIILSCFMFPFYADELFTMAERIIDKQSLTLPHRRHLYQVLANEAGIAHWKISLNYGISQLAVGLIIWLLILQDIFWGILGVVVFIFMFFIVNMKIKKRFSSWIIAR